MACMTADCSSSPSTNCGMVFSMFLHLHRLTAAATCLTTSAGGSTRRFSACPVSVMTLPASITVHFSLAHVAMKAAAGPYTLLQGRGARMRIGSFAATIFIMVTCGSHDSHMANAHCPIGSSCESKAGSAFPFGPPSAAISWMSRFCPPGPPAVDDAAPVVLRKFRSIESETPMMAWP